MNGKAMYATFILAIQLIVHLFRRLIGRQSPGLNDFLNNYREDGIPAMSQQDKQLLQQIAGCVTCRLCDSMCPALPHTNPADFMGPSFYPSSASRLIPDYPFANLDTNACDSCAGCDSICPRSVPIRDTFELMRRKVESIAA